MTDRLFRKYDEIVRERNLYRQELGLYREAFDALVRVVEPDDSATRKDWNVEKSHEAEEAVRNVLRYRERRHE